jgi:hypothetical protein
MTEGDKLQKILILFFGTFLVSCWFRLVAGLGTTLGTGSARFPSTTTTGLSSLRRLTVFVGLVMAVLVEVSLHCGLFFYDCFRKTLWQICLIIRSLVLKI